MKSVGGQIAVRIVHNYGEGANLVELCILPGEGLSVLRDLWTETQVGSGQEKMNGVPEDFHMGDIVSVGGEV